MKLTWMMWLDGDPRKSPEEAIREAMAYYERKYGAKPNRVQVPMGFEEIFMEGVLIEHNNFVMKNHLIIALDTGIEDRKSTTNGGRSVRK